MTRSRNQSKDLRPGEFFGDVAGKRRLGNAIVSEVVHRDARRLPEHSHELPFFTLLLEGSYSESYGRKSFDYTPFTMLWHRSGIAHKDEIGNRGGRFLSVEITPEGRMTMESYAPEPSDFYERSSPLVWLGCKLYHEFRNWQKCSDLVAEGITLEMLALAARRSSRNRKRPPRWLLTVTDKLDSEFRENTSSAELAAAAGVHPVHLAATFRQFHGSTIGEYVRSRRVEFACSALAEKDRHLAEIALDAGFSDQSHFTRIFRKITGITPGAFRESLAGIRQR